MSILIKGMEMPKNCETCELFTTDSSGFFGCCVTGNIVMRKREQDRPSWCPLVELPPHGKWLYTPTHWVYCSECGKEPPDECNITSDFCPNCGAEMSQI